MKTTTSNILSIAILAAASVSAQTATTTASTGTSTCAAQSILDACLDTTEGYVDLCGSTDYSCLCDKYTAIMTCFANCPNDSRSSSLDSQRQLYCANASAFATTTTTAKTASSTDSSATPTASEESSGATSSHAGSATKTSAPTESPTGAADSLQRGTGLMGAVVGVVAAVLL
ncbi:hypothetical protein RRF57_010310 [Xylaria bambusicola]|uniref:GPI anchored serine-threonine rich protein n=1 Tax=Xylaria bambusicola TaxID=326684 RepID=A0AAN7Z9G2_9PEZI